MTIRTIALTRLPVNHRGDWLFVEVDCGDLVGLGEASQSGDDRALESAIGPVAESLIGLPLAEAIDRLRLRRGDAATLVDRTVVSALDQALWDLHARDAGMSVSHLLGGRHDVDSVPIYANVNRSITDRTPVGFARAATAACDEGFTAIKIAPFDEVDCHGRASHGSEGAWRAGIARSREVRRAVGDDVAMAVDCHGRLERDEALAVSCELAELGIMWYEEPFYGVGTDANDPLPNQFSLPIASGEYLFGLEEFAPLLRSRLVEVLMPDVKHCGGIAELKYIGEAARMSGLSVAPHNPSGPVATAASAQVASSLPSFRILEYAWGEVEWRGDIVQPAERVEAGRLLLPGGTGIGCRLDHHAIRSHGGHTTVVAGQISARSSGLMTGSRKE